MLKPTTESEWIASSNYNLSRTQMFVQREEETMDEKINPSNQGILSTSSSLGNNHTKPTLLDKGRLEESDEDLFRVPDVANRNSKAEVEGVGKSRRGRNPVDKEYRRLKRLLRNRVSAQQARERKKVYVNELESKAKELEDNNSRLEEKISTLINENTMLRKVLMNTRPKADDHASKE